MRFICDKYWHKHYCLLNVMLSNLNLLGTFRNVPLSAIEQYPFEFGSHGVREPFMCSYANNVNLHFTRSHKLHAPIEIIVVDLIWKKRRHAKKNTQRNNNINNNEKDVLAKTNKLTAIPWEENGPTAWCSTMRWYSSVWTDY